MLLLPVGHEQESTRRLPWGTFGAMIVCAAAFLLTGFGASRTEWDTLEAYRKAAEHWIERPYLELDPAIERTLHGVATPEMREAFREGMRVHAERPGPETLEREQAELDRLCLAAKNAAPDHPFYRWGLVPSRMGLVPLLAHMFLHAGWLHLLGNLFMLYLVGPWVEDVWGRPVFAALYLVGGIVAALCFAIPHRELTEPLVGASGAIAAVMGAFAVRHAGTRLRFFWALSLGVRGTFMAPAWIMLGLWFLQQIAFSLATSGGAAGSVAGSPTSRTRGASPSEPPPPSPSAGSRSSLVGSRRASRRR